jgi:hypothetical protein
MIVVNLKNMKTLIINRPSSFINLLRDYKIEVDGNIVNKIKDSETLKFELPDNTKSLKLLIDWCGSESIDISKYEVCTITVYVNKYFIISLYALLISSTLIFVHPNFAFVLVCICITFIFYYITFGRFEYLKINVTE